MRWPFRRKKQGNTWGEKAWTLVKIKDVKRGDVIFGLMRLKIL